GVIDPGIAYSTYVGGTDLDIPTYSAVDRFGSFYVVGWTLSTDFPTTPGAYQPSARGNVDAFVTKLSPDGTTLIYSTYLGGGGDDFALSLDVDRAGNAYRSEERRVGKGGGSG